MTHPTEQPNQASGEVDPANPDWDTALCTGFARYRSALHNLPAKVGSVQLPFAIPIPLHLVFDTMAGAWGETSENHWWRLTNEVNDLGYSLDKLSAWQTSLDSAESSDERLALLTEFVSPLTHHSLNLPMALKSRFAFAGWRICDEMDALLKPVGAEIASASQDRSKAPRIFNDMWKKAARWDTTNRLKEAVVAIYPQERDDDPVFSYRDRFMHRMPPYLEQGVWGQANLVRSGGKWTVRMHEEPPLRLSNIVETLVTSHTAARRAREALGELLREQWAEVVRVYPSARES